MEVLEIMFARCVGDVTCVGIVCCTFVAHLYFFAWRLQDCGYVFTKGPKAWAALDNDTYQW